MTGAWIMWDPGSIDDRGMDYVGSRQCRIGA